jgi:streptomycin 6-kinase
MSGELLPGLREYLVGRFGPEARQARVAPLEGKASGVKEGGYGVPYRVSWQAQGRSRTLVLETVRPGQFGHEDRSDRAGILLRAFDEYGSLPGHVAAVDVGAFRADGPAVSLGGTGEFFILTEFVEGEPYAADFERIAETGRLEARDRARAAALADYLAGLHREPVRHPSWYRRRLRDLVGSGECLAGVADSYPVPAGFVDAALLEEVERLALAWRYRLRDRGDRLRTIHGDFHPWNILFRGGTDFTVLDRSRGEWGEPADDVATMTINYLFFSLQRTGRLAGAFETLFNRFWERYLAKTNDRELLEVIAPFYAWRGLVIASPIWYPHLSTAVRKTIFTFIRNVLKTDRFAPLDVKRYLA